MLTPSLRVKPLRVPIFILFYIKRKLSRFFLARQPRLYVTLDTISRSPEWLIFRAFCFAGDEFRSKFGRETGRIFGIASLTYAPPHCTFTRIANLNTIPVDIRVKIHTPAVARKNSVQKNELYFQGMYGIYTTACLYQLKNVANVNESL